MKNLTIEMLVFSVLTVQGLLVTEATVGPVKANRNHFMPKFDATQYLIGRTIYIEYNYYPGSWIAPSTSYDGILQEVAHEDIFEPSQGVRLEVQDCLGGYACLRTRWMEDEESNRFLQSGYLDVDFESDPAPQYTDQLQWQVFCMEEGSTDDCWICDKYYSQDYPDEFWSCLYATSISNALQTDWNSDHPADWFSWRIETVTAEDKGFVETSLVCNNGGNEVVLKQVVCKGVSINDLHQWEITPTITDELRASFKNDIVDKDDDSLHSTEWDSELSLSEAFVEQRCSEEDVTIPDGFEVALIQLMGAYGPYVVQSSTYEFKSRQCSYA